MGQIGALSGVSAEVAEELDPKRLENLFLDGVDENSYCKYHNYLTLVTMISARSVTARKAKHQ